MLNERCRYYWVVQYNIIRTELRKTSSMLTTVRVSVPPSLELIACGQVVNIAKHHFLEVADSIDSMRMNVEAMHEVT